MPAATTPGTGTPDSSAAASRAASTPVRSPGVSPGPAPAGGSGAGRSRRRAKLGGRRGAPSDIYSIGLQLGNDGSVGDSIVGGPAFEAGISSGMKVIAVNGRVYTHDLLEDAIKAAKDSTEPIKLLYVTDEFIHTAAINYHGGERYPHLVRDEAKPDYLDELIKPQAATK